MKCESVSIRILLCLGLLLSGVSAYPYSNEELDSVITSQESEIQKLRDQEINQIKVVLGRRLPESRKPEILLRLAELYTEAYRFYFIKENEIHQKALKQGLRPKRVNHDLSYGFLNKAQSSCLSILESKVTFDKMDQVYYFLGYNAQERGKQKEAFKNYELIAKKFPESPYASEAFRNLGEHAFEKKDYAGSVIFYERASQFKNVPSYPRTLYKLSWAYFKVKRKSEALELLKKVINLSGSESRFVGLRDEALRDLVLFFAEAGRTDEAHQYFKNLSGGSELYVQSLSRLSNLYEKDGHYKQALNVNNALIREYSDSEPELVYDILGRNVELYRKLGDLKNEEVAINLLVQFYLKHASIIKAKNKDGEGDQLANFVRTKNYIRSRATDVHKDAQSKNNPKLYSRAADLYQLYINTFLKDSNDLSDPKDKKDQAQIRTYLADALISAKRESEGIQVLELILNENPESKHQKSAGTTLINLLIKKIDSSKPGSDLFTEYSQKFKSVTDSFEKNFPRDALIAEIKFKRARLAQQSIPKGLGPQGIPDEAKAAYLDLIRGFPDRPEAIESAQDLVSDQVKKKNLSQAGDLAKEFLSNSKLMAQDKKGDVRKYFKSVISHESFSEIQSIESSKNYASAASRYEELAKKESADSEVSYKALNNAAVNYEKAGDIASARKIYEKMAIKFPRKTEAKEALQQLASKALWSSNFEQAATEYSYFSSGKGIGETFSTGERFNYLKNSVYILWGIGLKQKAMQFGLKGYNTICIDRAPKKCNELFFDLVDLSIDLKQKEEGVQLIKKFLARKHQSSAMAEAYFKLGQLYSEFEEHAQAKTYFEKSSKAGKHSDDNRERSFAARSTYLLVEPLFKKFKQIKLAMPESVLKAATKEKLAMLDVLAKRYQSVVEYGDGEWGIAALERMGESFYSFSEELKNAPIPDRIKALSAEVQEKYRSGILNFAEPLAEKAMGYFKQGYQRGLKLHVTTSTFVQLSQRIQLRMPSVYPAAFYSVVTDKESGRQSVFKLVGKLDSNFSQWRADINEQLKSNPKSVDAWIAFGNLEALSGRFKLARLLYEQGLAIAPKNAAVLNNIAVIMFLERNPIEATQAFLRAQSIAEFNKEIKLNLAKVYLASQHFSMALEQLVSLASRFSDDTDISTALAVALLGSGQVAKSGQKLDRLGAKNSAKFTLWYNWAVWALIEGNSSDKKEAVALLAQKRGTTGDASFERQIDLLSAVARSLAGSSK